MDQSVRVRLLPPDDVRVSRVVTESSLSLCLILLVIGTVYLVLYRSLTHPVYSFFFVLLALGDGLNKTENFATTKI